jgi:putative peptidoglycan binding domain protein
MGKTVDERVVSMGFENRDFESNVKTSMSTLDRLKQALKFDGASKGLENISSGIKGMNFNPLTSGIDVVRDRFSALEIAGVTAMVRITNAAITTGKNMMSALTIDPIKTGFSEYETQMNAVQTILANTSSKGSSLQDVNRALGELNTYADKTIYNFTEMTRNIGTFTAAGVSLDKSVTSIKGIANLAAVSGSTSQQASTAMYQLSQALAAGKVQLMDWNSVVNAGMGGEVFQNALKRTATQMGTNVDALIQKYGSFRESLSKGEWLTADVLTETLTQLSGAYTEADLIAKGYTEEQAKQITQLADTAVNAATKVKTFTQLWDTLKEAAQSGWTQSWQIMVGDFEEAKDLLTSISDSVGAVIGKSADARNKLLSEGLSTGWKQILDQGINDADAFKESIKSVAKEQGVAVDDIITKSGSFEKSLGEGWVTADILGKSINKLTDEVSSLSEEELKARGYTLDSVKALKSLNEYVKDGSINLEDFAKRMSRQSGRENMIEGFKNAFQSLGQVITAFKESFREFFPATTGEQLYNLTVKFKQFTASLKPSEEAMEKIRTTFRGLFAALDLVRYGLGQLLKPFAEFFGGSLLKNIGSKFLDISASMGQFFIDLNKNVKSNGSFQYMQEVITNVLTSVSGAVDAFIGKMGGFKQGVAFLGKLLGSGLNNVKNLLAPVVEWLRSNLTIQNLFAGLVGGGIFAAFQGFRNAIKNFSEGFDEIKEKITGFMGGGKEQAASGFKQFLGSIQDSLSNFSQGVKVVSVLAIAASVTLLVSAIERLSKLNPEQVAGGIFAISVMMKVLNKAFKDLVSSVKDYGQLNTVKAAVSLMLMAQAVKMLAKAVETFGNMSWKDLAKGLIGVRVAISGLTKGLSAIKDVKISPVTAVSLLILAESIKILGKAAQIFANMSWEEIAKGLAGMGGALAEFVGASAILNRFSGGKSIGGATSILIMSISMGMIAKNLKSLSELSWEQIQRGLTAMGGALSEFVGAAVILQQFSGFGSILGATSILMLASTLDEISSNLKKLGSMSWKTIQRGLTAMGGALAELVGAAVILQRFSGFKSVAGATSILIMSKTLDEISDNLKKLGSLSWEQIGKGLTAMGGALTELGGVASAVGNFGGFSSILGAASIKILVDTLDEISENMKKLGDMSWESIAKGLTGMGGALAELGTAASAVGNFGGFGSILGATSIVIAVQSLDEIASALTSLSALGWEDIARGLTAMGGALAELGTASGLTGNLGGFMSVIGGLALESASANIDKLGDAFVKMASLSWDEIGRGLSAMAGALGTLAVGGFANTLSIIGSMSISAAAEPLGVLADSVKKWSDVTVPENMGVNLVQLADGVRAFTLSGFGAGAIDGVAEPLGVMADSVRKWDGVNVPEGMAKNLGDLAEGVNHFFFSGFPAGAIKESAEPLGTMAESIKKWEGVSIPEGMNKSLGDLAEGVNRFFFSGFSAGSIREVAEPLGVMADSVRKWDGVTISEDAVQTLDILARGIGKLWSGQLGAGVISGLAGPLGVLADSVRKWQGLIIADSTLSSFTKLSEIIEKFGQTQMGAVTDGSMQTAIDTMKSLVETINSMGSVDLGTIDKIKEAFEKLGSIGGEGVAEGLQNGTETIKTSLDNMMSEVQTAMESGLSNFKDSTSTLGSDISTDISEGLTQGLEAIGPAIDEAMSSLESTLSEKASTSLSESIAGSLKSSLGDLSGTITTAISEALGSIGEITADFDGVGARIGESLASGVSVSGQAVISAISNVLSEASSTVDSYSGSFSAGGTKLGTGLTNGVRTSTTAIRSSITSALNSAVSAIGSYYSNFYSAGGRLAQGLANGISANSYMVAAQASAMASQAASAARKALDIHSPSRVFYAIGRFVVSGFANSLNDGGDYIYDTAMSMANAAKDGMNKGLDFVGTLLDSTMNNNPTITPILDLSSVKRSASALGGLLGIDPLSATLTRAVSVGDVSPNRQNDIGTKVATAISDLKKVMDSTGNTYVIDGITYDDGSAVSTAMESLIRAARIERRV